MQYHDSVILVYAKAPVEGTVNTRLIPDIGVKAATRLQFDFIHQRLSMLTKAKLADVILMCAPDVNHECFLQCRDQYSVELTPQCGTNLGERLIDGVDKALSRYKYCVVIGTDAPALNENSIALAIESLHKDNDVVFIPAEDGGYVLVALRRPLDFLFHDIDWGTPQVMQQSRDQLKRHDVGYAEQAMCWDVDRLEDYQRYLAFVSASQAETGAD